MVIVTILVKCIELTLVRHLPEGVDAGGGVPGGGETGHPRHHVTEQRPWAGPSVPRCNNIALSLPSHLSLSLTPGEYVRNSEVSGEHGGSDMNEWLWWACHLEPSVAKKLIQDP